MSKGARPPAAWLARSGVLLLLVGLALIVLDWPASGDSTVSVTQDGFTLTCAAAVAEGETLGCTLTNTAATAEAWPVVALVHLSDDEDRALVVGSPIDAAFAARLPAAELDNGVEWIGETLVGYSRFDWSGEADAAPQSPPSSTPAEPGNSRTVNIAISDDALHEGNERFYVALGPDGSRGVGLLSTNKAAVTITEGDAKSSNASLTSLVVTAGATQHTLSTTSAAAQTVTVGYQATEATLTAETAHQRAAMTIAATQGGSSVVLATGDVTSLAVTSGEESASVPLSVGTTRVTLTVTAEDGTTAAHQIDIVRSAIGNATTVTVSVDDFVLSCPADAEEGSVVECTLTNTASTSRPWPVVAVLHSAVDQARALVSEDSVIADSDPAYSKDLTLSEQTPERDGFNHGYGELFSGGARNVYRVWGYEKFDWDGSAAPGVERTVIIELHDDLAAADDPGETEVFYVALATSEYSGLSQLTENTAPILLRQKSSTNVVRAVSFNVVSTTSAEAVVHIANTDGSTLYWRYRRSGQSWPATQPRQNAGNVERLSLTGLTAGSRYELQVSFASAFTGAPTHTLEVGSLDSDPSLSSLSLGSVALSPAFASGTTSYTASVPFETDSVTVTAVTTETSATAAISPADADGTAAGHQVNLGIGQTDITVKVTAQSGATRTYTVTVDRAGDDPSLGSLSLGDVALSPAFASGTTSYTASVPFETDSVTMTAATTETSATAAISPADADGTAAGHQVNLGIGQTDITVKVTARNGAPRTYTITVTRAAPDDDPSLSSLSSASVTARPALSPVFASGTTSYTASVAYEVDSVTMWYEATQVSASLTVSPVDADPSTPGHQANLGIGQTDITVKVTAQSGRTRTYTVTVTRAAPDSDPSLSSLSLGSVALSPSFTSATTSYTASTASGIGSVTVSATTAEASASAVISPADADGTAAGHQVDLRIGQTDITVKVTAQSGATRIYTVTVTRAGSTTTDDDIRDPDPPLDPDPPRDPDPPGPTGPIGPGGGGGDEDEDDSRGEAVRLWGSDRYATSLAVARRVVALNDGRLDTVVLAGGRSWTDALIAGPLAGSLDAALLLTAPDGLPADTVAWLEQVGVRDIVAVGDTDHISDDAVAALAGIDPDIERIAHPEGSYAAAAALARRIGPPAALGPALGRTVIVASGQVFADALAAGPLAAGGPHPVLYADTATLHPHTAAYLAEYADHVVIMGGTAAVSAGIEAQIRAIPQANRTDQRPMAVTRLGGADRYATAVAFARWLDSAFLDGVHCFTPDTVGLATGTDPADAAASAPLLARRCAPLLLTRPDRIPPLADSYLRNTSELIVFGGPKAINRTALHDWNQ